MNEGGPPGGRGMLRDPRPLALAVLALLNIATIGAGAALAGELPARLALWRIPAVASPPLAPPRAVLPVAGTSGPAPTSAGLAARLSRLLSDSALGKHVEAVVANPASGKVLFSHDGASPSAPASTAKLGTAVAALATLGPGERFTTRVAEATGTGSVPARIVLVGGGDPTLAAGSPPKGSYPRPATLQRLAALTAVVLRAQHHGTVRLGYDASLFSGPSLAPGWPMSYVATGNVTPISSLEVDQGRLLPDGLPQDADEGNSRPRSLTPAADAAAAFRRFLARDGIRISGAISPARATAGYARICAVSSPPLAPMVEQMLTESNNVIAENLARHVALATGEPASFSGAATAVTRVLARLGASGGVHLVDGSGLSPDDRIPAQTLVRVVAVAASPGHPGLRAAITGMPVAGFSGTLSAGQSVFGDLPGAARGLVRAKTGNLNTVVSLAGLVYDHDGTMLDFAFMADKVPAASDLGMAAGVIDRLAGALTGCGCR